MKNKLKIVFFFFLAFFITFSCNAEQISLKLKNSLHGLAEYTQGDSDKPVVFILHGILQTHHFATIQAITNHVAELGYSTLSPTLSLGIDSRQKTLSCEAIHTHDMEGDANEIEEWITWLRKKTAKPIIFIGHSAGNTQILHYLKRHKNKQLNIQKILFISIAYFGKRPSSHVTLAEINRAKMLIKNGQLGPDSFGLTYCKKYVTLPKSYLSYTNWSKEQTALETKNSKYPITLLFGSSDKRIDPDWKNNLTGQGLDVQIVEGANHFFNGEHEFDMLDFIEETLEK